MRNLIVFTAMLALALLGSAPDVVAYDPVYTSFLWSDGISYLVGPYTYVGGRLSIGNYGGVNKSLVIRGNYQMGIGFEYTGMEAGGGPSMDFYNNVPPIAGDVGREFIGSIGVVTETNNTGTGRIYLQTRGLADAAPQVRMTVTGAGNVGIGTLSPAAKLDVVGTIYADDVFVDKLGDGVMVNVKDLAPAVDLSGILARLAALEDAIEDLPPGLRNIDRNGDGY